MHAGSASHMRRKPVQLRTRSAGLAQLEQQENTMLRKLTAAVLLSFAAASTPVTAQTPEVTLTRLDCGTQVVNDISGRFTDTFAYPDWCA